MGNDPSSNGNENNKKEINEKNKVKGMNSENNNKLDIVREKRDPKILINNIITNIQLNQEIDQTKGLKIECLDKFIDTIFPESVPNDYIEMVRNQIHEIKNVEIGMQNNIKNIFEIKNIDNKSSCYFICSIKKISETKVNIAYKFNIINVSITPIEKKSNEIEGQGHEQYRALMQNEIKKEFKKLNNMI